MWVLPVVSAVLAIVSLLLFCWAFWAQRFRGERRFVVTMRAHDPYAGASREATDLSSDGAETGSGLPRVIAQMPWVDHLQSELLRADWMIRGSEFIALSTLIAVSLGAMLMLLTKSAPLSLAGVAFGGTAIWVALRASQASRNRTLSAQLPDALDMLCSSMRAGFSVGQAMHRVQAQSAPPLAEEFGRALEEIRLGRSLADALEGTVLRSANYDLALVVSAIQTQLEVGGNMSEVLEKIASMIRERVRLKEEVAIAAAEGRLSAVVLVAMPLVMVLLIRILNPQYLDPLTGTYVGRLMLATAGVLMVLGALVLRKLTTIDV